MTLQYRKIILVSDGTENSLKAEQTVINFAKSSDTHVRVIDTVRPPSLLSKWFESNVDDVHEMVVADKQSRLEQVAERIKANGISVEVEVLCGNSSQEIARDVLSFEADLVVRYMKGVRSKYPGLFGNTARNLMRACPCPLLLVGEKPLAKPVVLACVNAEHDREETDAIIAAADTVTGGDRATLLYCWNFFGGELYLEHMGENAYRQSLNEAEQIHLNLFANLLKQHDRALSDSNVLLENGDPVDVIPDVCKQESTDVVVMSSGTLNHPMHRLLGSTIESVLEQIPCALLVVKPTAPSTSKTELHKESATETS